VPKLLTIAAALLALAVSACGDDDDNGAGRPAKKGKEAKEAKEAPLFDARERATDIERDIVRRAKREDRAAGNDPADYTYDVRCVPKSDVLLTCRLDLTDRGGETVNTVAYQADVDPDTGDFGYKVTANRDTRAPAGR
jgi:hypothetical protein